MSETDGQSSSTDTWEGILDALRRRYPGQKDSVLFCIYKLQQNPELTLRDFREEAALYGIPMAGRALHSARGLLGLVNATAPARTPTVADRDDEPAAPRPRRHRATVDDGGESIERRVLDAVRNIQSAAEADADRLRNAMRQAIALLQRALGE